MQGHDLPRSDLETKKVGEKAVLFKAGVYHVTLADGADLTTTL